MTEFNQSKIVELIDETGTKTYFSHITTVEYKDEEYVVLQPVEEMEDVSVDEVMILHITRAKDGTDVYEGIGDEKLLQEVFDYFLENADDVLLDDDYELPGSDRYER